VVIALAPFLLHRPFFVQRVPALRFRMALTCKQLWSCVASVFGLYECVFFLFWSVASFTKDARRVARPIWVHVVSDVVLDVVVTLWLVTELLFDANISQVKCKCTRANVLNAMRKGAAKHSGRGVQGMTSLLLLSADLVLLFKVR
jgi:hypothetical protein